MSHNNITYQMHTDKSQYQTPNLWPPSLQRLHLFPMHLGQNLQNKIKSVFSNPNVISSSHLKNFRNPHHTSKTSGIPPTPQKPQESPPHPPLFQENKQIVRQNFEKKRWIIGVECVLYRIVVLSKSLHLQMYEMFAVYYTRLWHCSRFILDKFL